MSDFIRVMFHIYHSGHSCCEVILDLTCRIRILDISYIQKVQYCERSLLESQRPGTVLHSFFAGTVHLTAGLYWWASSGLYIWKSASSCLVWGRAPKMIRSWSTSAGEAEEQGLVGKGRLRGLWQQPPSTYREVINMKTQTLHSSTWWEGERQERFRLDIGEVFFIMTTARQWRRLPREVVQALFLEVFTKQLDKAVSYLVWPQTWTRFEQELGLETSWGPFQLGLCSCSVINLSIFSLSSVVLSPIHRDLKEKWHSLRKWEM